MPCNQNLPEGTQHLAVTMNPSFKQAVLLCPIIRTCHSEHWIKKKISWSSSHPPLASCSLCNQTLSECTQCLADTMIHPSSSSKQFFYALYNQNRSQQKTAFRQIYNPVPFPLVQAVPLGPPIWECTTVNAVFQRISWSSVPSFFTQSVTVCYLIRTHHNDHIKLTENEN